MASSLKPLTGVLGVFLAASAAQLNDQVIGIGINDVAGGFSLGHDASTWLTSLYVSAEVVGMALSPWLLVTFTIRQFTLFVILLNALTTLLIPLSYAPDALYALRLAQGLSGGFTIPLLLTAALRVLPPNVRLYGLAVYALTATFFPALSGPLAAFAVDRVGWQFLFWDTLPLCTVAALLAWWGLPQDTAQFERFARFDWRGALLILVGLGSFTTMLQQGDRYDWFASPTITILGLISLFAIPALIVNEWFHELPLLKLQMLRRANLAYGLLALLTFTVVGQSASGIPYQFLEQIGGFRPEQIWPLTALIAGAQFVMLPLTAWVMDHPSIDARLVHGVGLVLVLAANVGASSLSVDWSLPQLVLWEALQAVGQPLVVLSLLLIASNEVRGPDEAPFASALVNTPRAVAEAAGVWLVQLVQRWRGGLHYNRLADQAGQERFSVLQSLGIPGGGSSPQATAIGGAIRAQASILTFADLFLIFAAIIAVLIVLLALMTHYSPPPSALAARK